MTTWSPHTSHPTHRPLEGEGGGTARLIPDLRSSFLTQEKIFSSDQSSSSRRCLNHSSRYQSGALQYWVRRTSSLTTSPRQGVVIVGQDLLPRPDVAVGHHGHDLPEPRLPQRLEVSVV